MPAISPLTVSDLLDLRNGSVFQVFTVHHTTGAQSTMAVEQSAVSACELGVLMTSGSPGISAGLAKETSSSAGIALGAGSGGLKNVQIGTSAATGTYTIVVRYSGSGSGIGSSK